eukprot:scaffold29891_cov21-Tisochrysis_lutea.AAC.2
MLAPAKALRKHCRNITIRASYPAMALDANTCAQHARMRASHPPNSHVVADRHGPALWEQNSVIGQELMNEGPHWFSLLLMRSCANAIAAHLCAALPSMHNFIGSTCFAFTLFIIRGVYLTEEVRHTSPCDPVCCLICDEVRLQPCRVNLCVIPYAGKPAHEGGQTHPLLYDFV